MSDPTHLDAPTALEASTEPSAALNGLLHPVTLAALAVWVVNDHLLKGAGPGWLTGKLFDVACLAVVPWMPLAAYVLLTRTSLSRRWLVGSCALTGLVMVTINLFDGAAWAYRHGLAGLQWPLAQLGASLRGHGVAPWRPVHLTMDASDLWTLPALLLPLRLWREESP